MTKPTRSWSAGLGLKTVATLLLSTLLISCGSSKKYDEFAPSRIVAAGDGMSYLGVAPGYANPFTVKEDVTIANVNGTYDHWLKQFGYGYGLTSIGTDLNGTGNIISLAARPTPGLHGTPPSGFGVLDTVGGVPGIKSQIDAAIASHGIRADDLLVLSVGMGDILELSEKYLNGTITSANMLTQAKARGQAYMDYANQLYQDGVFKRIILVTPLNLRVSPYAKNALPAGLADAGGLIDKMTEEFVYGTKTNASTYPRSGGVWLFDATNLLLNVNLWTTINMTDPFCAKTPAVLETCDAKTTADATSLNTLNTDVATYYNSHTSVYPVYFYAGSLLPTPFIHRHLGSTMYSRMRSGIGF